MAVGCFAAFASTARLLWSWRASWTREATLGAAVAVLLFLLAALFLWLAIYQPWRRRLEGGGTRHR